MAMPSALAVMSREREIVHESGSPVPALLPRYSNDRRPGLNFSNFSPSLVFQLGVKLSWLGSWRCISATRLSGFGIDVVLS